MNEIEILQEELFCTRYEARIFAGYINYGKLERWIPDFSDVRSEDSHVKRYDLAKDFVQGKRVLDIACGSGRGTYMLANAAALEVVGVDLDTEAIRYAKHRHQHEKTVFIHGNAEQYVRENYYDVAVSFETIEHLNNVDAYLSCIYSSLKPGGTFLVSTPIADKPHNTSPNNIFHVQEWGFENFQTVVSKHFSIQQVYVQFYPRINSRIEDLIKRISNKFDPNHDIHKVVQPLSTISLYTGNENKFDKALFGKKLLGYQLLVCVKK